MEPAPRPRPRSVIGWVTLALALLAAGVAGVLDNFGVVHMTPVTTLAVMLTVVGAGLMVASVWGRAGWLILVGFLLLPVVAASSVLGGVSFSGRTGNVTERPLIVADVQPEYRLGAGDFNIDLSAVQFGREQRTIDVRLGAGDLTVVVPAEQPVTVHTQVGAGEVRALGHPESNGIDVRSNVTDGRPSAQLGQLTLDIRVGLGSVRVERGP